MSDRYKAIAPCYDQATAWFMSGPRAQVAGLLRESVTLNGTSFPGAAIHPAAPLRVLDIGCGTGGQLLALLAAGMRCAGVDDSPRMLAVARKNILKYTRKVYNAPCGLIRASADKLPFGDGSFDAAVLSLILHESPADPLAIMQEAFRVAPRLILLDWKMPERNLDYLAHPFVCIVERLAGRGHYGSFRRFMKVGGLEGLLYQSSLAAGKKNSRRPQAAGRRLLRFGAMLLLDVRLDAAN